MIGFALLLCASISCSAQNFEYKSEINDKKASNDSKDAKASADESASVPAIVTGSYLFCEELESSNTLERKVACNAFDQDDNLLSLEDEARDYSSIINFNKYDLIESYHYEIDDFDIEKIENPSVDITNKIRI